MRKYDILDKDKVLSLIKNGDTVAFSGFSPAGGAKTVPGMLAEHAVSEHRQNRAFRIRVLTGASAGDHIDNDLAKANAIQWRAPYQGGRELRDQINRQEVEYVDMHLSHLAQTVSAGFSATSMWRGGSHGDHPGRAGLPDHFHRRVPHLAGLCRQGDH